MKRHPIVTALLAAASFVWLGFGFVIGGIPFFGLLWLLVAGGSYTSARLLQRRRTRANSGESSRAHDGILVVGVTAGVALAIFGVVQLVPYGRPQTYSKGTGEPAWATPQTRALMVRACYDCHSNEVKYPWYSRVAPVSWTVQHHIDEGHDAVNYSNFATDPRNGRDTIEVIQNGSMPPGYFTVFGLHSSANLTSAEKAELIAGLQATPGFQDKGPGDRRPDQDRD